MDVPYILNLMGTLSVGCDNVTDVESAIFLQYLNLAHMELYQTTARIDPHSSRLFKAQTSPYRNRGAGPSIYDTYYSTVTFPEVPHDIRDVFTYSEQKSLKRISAETFHRLAEESIGSGPPTMYRWIGSNVVVYPIPLATVKLGILYIPQAPLITIDMPTAVIPYPASFFNVLVDGALYYLFQEEGSFKNAQKANAAKERWDRGKESLLYYLYSISSESEGRISTFSPL